MKEPSHRITSIKPIRLENTISDVEKQRVDNPASKLPRSDPTSNKYLNEYNHTRKRSFDKMNDDEVGSTLSRPAKRTVDTSEIDFNSYVFYKRFNIFSMFILLYELTF